MWCNETPDFALCRLMSRLSLQHLVHSGTLEGSVNDAVVVASSELISFARAGPTIVRCFRMPLVHPDVHGMLCRPLIAQCIQDIVCPMQYVHPVPWHSMHIPSSICFSTDLVVMNFLAFCSSLPTYALNEYSFLRFLTMRCSIDNDSKASIIDDFVGNPAEEDRCRKLLRTVHIRRRVSRWPRHGTISTLVRFPAIWLIEEVLTSRRP